VRHHSAAGATEPAFRRRLDPVAHGLVAQSKLLAHRADALAIIDPFDRQFLELGRVGLLRHLHFLPSKSEADLMSPLADEISGVGAQAADLSASSRVMGTDEMS
jgi:hypothetical protein